MWRTLLVTVLCSASSFGHNIDFTGKETDRNPGVVFAEAIELASSESAGNVYYRTNLQPDVVTLNEDELPDDLQGKFGFPPDDSSEEEDPTFQPWSIVWYIGSFGGLIAFFLVVSCSEWCCRGRNRRRDSQNPTCASPTPSETPPPAYDLFAPPSYDSLCQNGEKRDYEVFVVPVHTMERLTENPDEASSPPPYFAHRTENISNEVVLNVTQIEEENRERHKAQREIATQT